jgi:hypothetical protein
MKIKQGGGYHLTFLSPILRAKLSADFTTECQYYQEYLLQGTLCKNHLNFCTGLLMKINIFLGHVVWVDLKIIDFLARSGDFPRY